MGKQNFILIVFVLFIIVVTDLYQTFSLVTTSEEITSLDNITTYKFILDASNKENSLVIASNSSKNVMINISNKEDITLKYGIYYSSKDELKDVSLGYLATSKYKGTDVIDKNTNQIVTLKIKNNSDNNITINFGVSYGFENGGDLILDTDSHWLGEYKQYLYEVEVGSYVSYVGNNGCSGNACRGENVNYVSDDDMGYCYSSDSRFTVNGWRVAYVSDDTAYLVSAGAIDCLDDEENTYEELSSLEVLDNISLKYCNSEYAYGEVCDVNSAWAMNSFDFESIVNESLSPSSCYMSLEDKYCGYNNDLIDNGSYYLIASKVSDDSIFNWDASKKFISSTSSNYTYGLRPILRLKSSIVVTSGKGTYKEPYIISNS